MKYQSLAVIFIIIILPISMILTSYVQNQVQTLQLQISYDTKLTNSTYDALKAFQLNALNSSTSDLANSKLRDIEASVNTFFNSMASNFNMAGYNKDILQNYVPAVVYTMYDGYYIYSPFTNTLEEEDEGTTYTNGEKVYGLKPYIFYSCRYKTSSIDVVITYTLDNYITVQGTINNNPVYRYGYLIEPSNITGSGSSIQYRGVTISPSEVLREDVAYPQEDGTIRKISNCPYVKINGIKYYNDGGTWFSMLNGTRYDQSNVFKEENDSAIKYYQDARDFTNWVRTNLGDLSSANAVDSVTGEKIDSFGNYEIFSSESDKSIEDPDSNFNQQRQAVIRYSIEKNLSVAIANYNRYSGETSANFQMPKLQEDEWEKIINNISIISFMQGISIGGKVYNGYSIVTNTVNEEVVNTDSIYLITSDGQYHKATDTDIGNNVTSAYLNLDFERKSVTNNVGINYYYPHNEMGCYSSIVSQSAVDVPENIYEYMAEKGGTVAQAYFTALGRERYSMYKTNNNPTELFKEFSTP